MHNVDNREAGHPEGGVRMGDNAAAIWPAMTDPLGHSGHLRRRSSQRCIKRDQTNNSAHLHGGYSICVASAAAGGTAREKTPPFEASAPRPCTANQRLHRWKIGESSRSSSAAKPLGSVNAERKMTIYEQFKRECADEIKTQGADPLLASASRSWINLVNAKKYSYHFEWLGRPVVQYPQDLMAMQEIVWAVQPDLIIETGIAHGGSLIFFASMLELNAACGGPSGASVLGIDIDIRAHNRAAVEAHPLSKRVEMIQGSSISANVVEKVRQKALGASRVLVSLDSNHTHDHVLAELEAYAPLVTPGSYCVVFDTVIEDMPAEMFGDRPWGPGNNPKTAARKYLETHPEFEVDKSIDHKLLVSVAPDGYLRRIK